MHTPLPTTETKLFISGPAGKLEAIFTPATAANQIGIICHPNPVQGGTMTNKVVTTAAGALHRLGISTIRFNYRGVGASEGSFGNAIGETEDLMAIIDWVQQKIPAAEFWLVGFSFGSYIAAQGAIRLGKKVHQLISIAPAVTHVDFNQFSSLQCPWLVIQGDEDEIVAPQAVYDWVKKMQATTKIQLIKIPATSHFFHGKLIVLRDIITSIVDD